ncbi:hypothetical protein ACFL0H_03965 [Thermodesulfobacteriota bacterium]
MGEEEIVKQMMQQAIGITDEDFNTHFSYPQNQGLARSAPELMKHKIIAEVTESKYCSAGLKVGQKFVFRSLPAMLLPDESDCPLCVRAIGPITNLVTGFWDRIVAGLDPNKGMWHMAECMDPGVERGGLGHVVFKVYTQKTD